MVHVKVSEISGGGAGSEPLPSWNALPQCLSLLKTDRPWMGQMFPPKSRCEDVTFPGRNVVRFIINQQPPHDSFP